MRKSRSVGEMIHLYFSAGMTWVPPGDCIDSTSNRDIALFVTDGHLLHPSSSQAGYKRWTHQLGHHTQALAADGKAQQIIPFISFVSEAVCFFAPALRVREWLQLPMASNLLLILGLKTFIAK